MQDILLNDRYRLDAELGGGGIGVVYRAYDLLLDREVAIKILSQASRERLGSEGRARLLHEARAAARLSHPNIVSVHDTGESAGVPFIVMEYVEGQPLISGKPEPVERILSIAQQVCSALEHAHSHGIVHRDLKPENIIITQSGTVKLLDFGLARLARTSQVSTEGLIVGTVFYLAPEQALSEAVDGRADLYALGVLMYEMAAGRLPFSGDEPLAVISQHLHTPPAQIRSLREDFPVQLEAVILRLLAKDPAERFQSAAEAAQAFAGAAASTALGGQTQPGLRMPPGPPHNLPLQLSRFIGREAEIEEVKQLLASSRLVTLTGLGGSGKTRLALQVASELLPEYPAGAWLVELAPLSDPGLVPQAVLSALGVAEQGGLPLIETLTGYLRSKRLLLLLDNCEHLIDACARLAGILLSACEGLTILATSREAFNISGENALYVPTLAAPDLRKLGLLSESSIVAGLGAESPLGQGIETVEAGSEPRVSKTTRSSTPVISADLLTELSRYASIQLFSDRARSVQPSFTLTRENVVLVAQICYHLDGIPLAIELAAARMRALTLDEIAFRLGDRFHLLTGGSRTAAPQHQTLRATIDWSHDLLSQDERTLFAQLSVFANGWSYSSAEAICTGDGREVGVPREHILDLLTNLVNKSLVMMDGSGPQMRYRMLETIRQYAYEKLEATGKAAEIKTRHLHHFLDVTDEAEANFRSANQLYWLDWCEQEHDNLRAALRWSLRCPSTIQGLRLAGNLALFWYFRGYLSEGRDWLNRLIGEARKAGLGSSFASEARDNGDGGKEDTQVLAKALYGAAWLADESGQEAKLYQESLALCRENGDLWGAAFSLRGLGVAAVNKEDYTQAYELLNESLQNFNQLGDSWGIALALFNLGWLAYEQSHSQEAKTKWEEALALFRESGDRWGKAVILDALSYLARLEGEYINAADLSKQGLYLFKELGDKAGIAVSLSRLGSVAYRREEFQQAAELFESSRILQLELGYPWSSANSLRMLGQIACYQGEYDLSEELIRDSLDQFRGTGSRMGLGLALASLGVTVLYRGDHERARPLFEESLIHLEEDHEKGGMAMAMTGLARIRYHEGDFGEAARLIEEAKHLNQDAGEKYELAASLVLLGRVKYAQGAVREAESAWQDSLSLRSKFGAKRGIAESLEALAGAALQGGALARAGRLFGAAGALREVAGAPMPPVERVEMEAWFAEAGRSIAELRASIPWREGREWAEADLERIISYALEMAN